MCFEIEHPFSAKGSIVNIMATVSAERHLWKFLNPNNFSTDGPILTK